MASQTVILIPNTGQAITGAILNRQRRHVHELPGLSCVQALIHEQVISRRATQTGCLISASRARRNALIHHVRCVIVPNWGSGDTSPRRSREILE